MVYHSNPTKLPLIFLIPLIVKNSIVTNVLVWVLAVIITLITIGIKYELRINDAIHYTILFFGKSIYKKSVRPSDIHKLILKDAGWGTPAAFVKVNKGFNLRILTFYPLEVLEEVKKFAVDHNIAISEKNHYQAVYDMKRRKKQNI